MQAEKISHHGIIKAVTPETISVAIIAQSACEACHSKGLCSVAGEKEKIIEVKNTATNEHKPGEAVFVTMSPKMGVKAVLWGYFVPFFIMLATLIIAVKATDNEGFSGLLAIAVLLPYYVILYLLRRKLQTVFEFKIETI
jgi:sigma-E factor negative regulatory protein RseC